MSLLRVSGKKFLLKPAEISARPPTSGWTFESRPGGWLIASDGYGNRFRIALCETRGKLGFSTRLGSGQGEIQKQSTVRQKIGASAAVVEAELTAQFPGKVRKILVSAGARVAEGDPLLLVEAMKMEFAIKAPAAGCVKKILVAEAQQLAPGDRFVDFEVDSDEQK